MYYYYCRRNHHVSSRQRQECGPPTVMSSSTFALTSRFEKAGKFLNIGSWGMGVVNNIAETRTLTIKRGDQASPEYSPSNHSQEMQ